MQGPKTAPDSPDYLVFDRRPVLWDVASLRAAATAESAERAVVSVDRCGYRYSNDERGRGTEHHFVEHEWPFVRVDSIER